MRLPTDKDACRLRTFLLLLVFTVQVTDSSRLIAKSLDPSKLDKFSGHPRVLIISDIGNEPDDQMSFVRFLLYANEFQIEAMVAATSTWQKTVTHPETMHKLIDAYSQVLPNLQQNASGWPAAEYLNTRVFSGQPAYGRAGTGKGKNSEGAKAIIRAVDDAVARKDERPVWICIWGGANTLAQALLTVRASRNPEELDAFVEKIRVYSISDQDDAGPWIRREFPDLFYIVQPSTPTGSEYYYATWTGISGDNYYRNGMGADEGIVTNAWLDANIRSKGPLGKLYPRFAFIMEGDTPSFLNLIDNGLAAWVRPDWGGWGGRYLFRQPYGETHAIWTQGGDMFSRVSSQDTVTGIDGRSYTSDQATIWRWRQAFQNDFSARMDWTINPPSKTNHAPAIVVNGRGGTEPIFVQAEVGKPIVLDANGTFDPDQGQSLTYQWFQYTEAGAANTNLSEVAIAGTDSATATLTPKAVCRTPWIANLIPCTGSGTAHIILAVTDDGSPKLTSYRRVVLTVMPGPSQKLSL